MIIFNVISDEIEKKLKEKVWNWYKFKKQKAGD